MSILRVPELSDSEVRNALQHGKTIAIVGLSNRSTRPSYGVARYLQEHGYQIVPVNPYADQILGEQAYPDLSSIPFDVDIVDIFRRPQAVAPHVDEAIQKGVKLVWLQLGIRNDEAAQKAHEAELAIVQDRCIKIEHMRLVRD